MTELDSFTKNLSTLCPDFRQKKYLLGISGGIDSMVMLHLFQRAGLDCSIAHVNFQLRDSESDRDRNFVFEEAAKAGIHILEKTCNTKHFAQKNRMNIQDAARKIRYDFFTETADINNFDFICTAHNLDDVVETLIMGLNRRGSLNTLSGIREMENRILRPLLHFSRSDIESYAAGNMVRYVEDSSNSSDKYLRNKIRHHLLPLFEEIMPGFSKRAAGSVSFLREYQKFVASAATAELLKLGNAQKEGIDLLQLQNHPSGKLLLMQFLLSHGFFPADAAEIFRIDNYSEPKEFLSNDKKLIVHRGKIILSEMKTFEDNQIWYIDEDMNTDHLPVLLQMEYCQINRKEELICKKDTALINPVEINFPLLVRKWIPGDRFIPFGMTQFKKVGDFFTDAKTTVAERNSTYVLCSGPHIIWIIGYRTDQRFMINDIPATALRIKTR